MDFKSVLVTGGAGFVGSNLALLLRQALPGLAVTALDSLKRRGSELNLPRLHAAGVRFCHGDVRSPEDLNAVPDFDLLIDCSAEPSVHAGAHGSPRSVLETNLWGTVNCLEAARARGAAFLFLSTSRVYPIAALNELPYAETATRFRWQPGPGVPGFSEHGVAEGFPLVGARVDDNSRDGTAAAVEGEAALDSAVRLVRRAPPSGFGRAVRSGLEAVRGDVVVIYMADQSDDPEDVVAYYRKIQEGYDCVFGSRFVKGSVVQNYPRLKLVVNRAVNRCVRLMFWTRFNDLTNAFKAYRTAVIRDCGPYRASHFNLTLEMSLGALIRNYHIAQIPIRWYGRTWGSSNLKLREMGRRYLSTLLMLFFQRYLIADDLMAERLASNHAYEKHIRDLETRLDGLEKKVNELTVPYQSVQTG